MSSNTDRTGSILIVTGSEQFAVQIQKVAYRKGFSAADVGRSAAAARRRVMERDYDIIVINAPLQEEFGHELAMDMADRGISVLMVVPSEVYDNVLENVTDYGIMVLQKPLSGNMADKAIGFLRAIQMRIRRLKKQVAKAEEKAEELRITGKAKLLLIEKKHMTEEEAHRFIGKQAMNNGVSRRRIAERIIDDLE